MRIAKAWRYDQIGEQDAAHRLPRVSERALGGAIEFDDPAVVVDRDDGIERRIQYGVAAVDKACGHECAASVTNLAYGVWNLE